MRIAICDDEDKDRRMIASFVKQHSEAHEIVEFTSANTFLAQLERSILFDLVFLDIQMPDSNGWDVAKLLKQSGSKIYIAMITVMNDYHETCYDRVDWFAAKPVSRDRIFMILDNAHGKLFPKQIAFATDKISLDLYPAEIQYIEVQLNVSIIRTRTGTHSIRIPLKKVIDLLASEPRFVQTHKSFVVNLDYYKRVSDREVILIDDTAIPLSRFYRDGFFSSLANYIKRR